MLRLFINPFSHYEAVLASTLLLALSCGFASTAASARTVYAQEQILATIQSSRVSRWESQFAGAVAANDTEALLRSVARLQTAPGLDPIASAYLLHQALMHFAQLPESPAGRAFLEKFLDREQRILVWHEEAGHRAAIVAYDASAAARFALGNWNRLAWARLASQDLAAGRDGFLAQWLDANRAAGGRLSPSGLADALQAADPAHLVIIRPRLASLLAEGEPVAPLASIAARNLQDLDLARSIIRDAGTADALAFLADIGRFDQADQIDLLAGATQRADLGSAALYRLGRIGAARADRLLLENLASPLHGGSAAAALSRDASAQRVAMLGDIVRGDAEPLAQRRAVLAMHLAGNDAALTELRSLAQDVRVSRSLRELIARKLP